MKKILALLFLLLFASSAQASQNPTTLPTASPYPGLTMLSNINSAFNTFQTNFSGASAPSSPLTWQLWLDTTNNLIKVYNGTVWEIVGTTGGSNFVPVSGGVPITAITSTGSANAYSVNYTPAATQLYVGNFYPFITNFQNTGSATLNVNGIGAFTITKQGTVSLNSGDLPNGMVVQTVWDGTEFQIVGQIGNSASGTVTSIATNNGITGGTITSAGTIGLQHRNRLF